jgi:tight adherence protein C
MNALDSSLIRNLMLGGFGLLGAGLIYIVANYYGERIYNVLRARSAIDRRIAVAPVEGEGFRDRVANSIRKAGLESLFKVNELRSKLIQAGERSPDAVNKVIFAKIMMPIACFFFAYQYRPASMFLGPLDEGQTALNILLSTVFAIASFGIPDFLVTKEIAKRHDSIQRAFPEAVDILYICVQAGMSFEQAVNRVTAEIEYFSPEIADEFRVLSAELSYLTNRRMALQNLRERVKIRDVEDFVLVIQQSERYGTALGDALRVMATEARTSRMLAVEKKALSLPPKLAVPITVFMLPGIVAMVFAPLILGGLPLP